MPPIEIIYEHINDEDIMLQPSIVNFNNNKNFAKFNAN